MSQRPFEGLVTPEAVVLQFETAGVGSRTAAGLIDWVIRIALIFLFSLAGGLLDSWVNGPAWLAVTMFTLLVFAVLVGYPVLFESLWHGRTPGKAALGLRVVTEEGAPIRFRHAAIRGALSVFEISATSGLVGIVAMFVSNRNQRLGDMVAGTLVLRERNAAATPVATAFVPVPGTEEYAASLDVAALTTDEYLTLRAFLTRAPGLGEPARSELGRQLADQFVNRLRTQPPAGMHQETFLVAVAAAYQRRFAGAGAGRAPGPGPA